MTEKTQARVDGLVKACAGLVQGFGERLNTPRFDVGLVAELAVEARRIEGEAKVLALLLEAAVKGASERVGEGT